MSPASPARRQIRVFPEYGRAWPLWEDSTPTWDVGYATTPEMYGLSAALTRDLAAWNELWNTHFDAVLGWTDAQSRRQWAADGDAVVARLRTEVHAFADVVYEPWPVSGLTP